MPSRWRKFIDPRGNYPLQQLFLPAAILLALCLLPIALVSRLDLLAYDLLSRSLGKPSAPAQAVVIAIDDASLQRFGPWPWPRQRYADLLEKLDATQASSVSFAILMDSPAHDPSGDAALASRIRQSPAVILPVLPAASASRQGIEALRSMEILRQSASEGHVDVEVDADGLTRRVFLTAGVDGLWWPALAEAARQRMPAPSAARVPSRMAPERHQQAGTWQRDAEVLLRNDRIGHIPTIPYGAVIDGSVPADDWRGKAVFVGATATGAHGGLAMANHESGVLVPAVEYHARVFEALQQGAVIRPQGVPATLLLGATMLLIALSASRGLTHHWSPLLLGFCLIPGLVSFALIHTFAIWIPPTAASGAMFALALGLIWRQIDDFEQAGDLLLSRTRVAMESIADGVILIDAEGRIEQVNKVSTRLLGKSRNSLKGQPCADMLGVSDKLMHGISNCLKQNHPVVLGEPINLPVIPSCTVRVSIGPVTGRDGNSRGAILVLSDITALVLAENRLKHQATHDPLTGLPNRTLIHDRLQQLLASMQRRRNGVAVLFLDLDRFKPINDGAGHQIGDNVLRTVSHRLRTACRAEDTVGRWGGDEFVILLSGDDSLESFQLVARKLIDEINHTITIDDSSYHLGASIGIALAPSDADSAEELIRLADLAMYRAKLAGGDRVALASPDMNKRSSQRLAIEVDLRQAIKRGQFEIHYQPQVSIDTHRLTGLEALIRWNRPGFGEIPPDQFIPIAEESGLINDIGNWVLNEVGRQIRAWREAGAPEIPVAINVSARQCQDPTLVGSIRQMLEKFEIPASQIEIEITETAAVQNMEHMTGLLRELASIGLRLAIDDFGTGYSSLAHLKCLPISVLKIDKSFVSGTPNNHEDSSISRATIALAHSLGMKVVAEGVENEPQRAFLDTENCDIAQGFLFSRPIPAADTLHLLLQVGSHPIAPSLLHPKGDSTPGD
ncbi:MAG: EAL domain-containing protein [Dechloromonas sp.]|nr:EAL domain-containing protein [Dechloromonas sp.]